MDPCDSDDWSQASVSSRRRRHNETLVCQIGIALRRLVARGYPSADPHTQDLLARDHFITHVGSGDLRVSLRSAKPTTLEAVIDLTTELELIRGLENNHLAQDAKVRGVSEQKTKGDEQIETLLGVVEGLRQEVKSLQSVVQTLKSNPVGSVPVPATVITPSSQPDIAVFRCQPTERAGGCWECGCT